jgi:hypothetical protein
MCKEGQVHTEFSYCSFKTTVPNGLVNVLIIAFITLPFRELCVSP